MKNGEWTTSFDREIFQGEEFETRELAIKCMAQNPENLEKGFWVGQLQECHTSEFIDSEDIIENAQCRADDSVGEVAEDWLSYFPQEHKDELNKLLVDWFDKNGYKPTFFRVTNIEHIKI